MLKKPEHSNKRAVVRNPPIHNSTGDIESLTIPTLKYVMFLRKYKCKKCFVVTTF
jgi:hypothetical protein